MRDTTSLVSISQLSVVPAASQRPGSAVEGPKAEDHNHKINQTFQ